MKLIACIDDRGGMLFNGRRVSSDCAVTRKILQLAGNSRLLVNAYTYQLFAPAENIICAEKPLTEANPADWCFVEDQNVSNAVCAADTVVLFHWNRTYPAELYFPLKELHNRLRLSRCEEFAGNSHPRITMEVYSR